MRFFKKYKNLNSPEEKKKIRKQLFLGLISGILIGISFPPIPLPYLIFIGVVPYLFALQQREGLGEINRLTYFTAFFFNIITLYWVGGWLPNSDPFLMIAGTTLFFFNPISSHFLIKYIVGPNIYWRLFYIFPLALLFGFSVHYIINLIN